jgi:ABC-type multidrug transport system ATPase subunit
LTAREHLTLFARIKGIPEANIANLINHLLEKLTLGQYADRVCGGYSGGNKRKLCVGLALIGHPPIVFLDEPSTGMDPASRYLTPTIYANATPTPL